MRRGSGGAAAAAALLLLRPTPCAAPRAGAAGDKRGGSSAHRVASLAESFRAQEARYCSAHGSPAEACGGGSARAVCPGKGLRLMLVHWDHAGKVSLFLPHWWNKCGYAKSTGCGWYCSAGAAMMVAGPRVAQRLGAGSELTHRALLIQVTDHMEAVNRLRLATDGRCRAKIVVFTGNRSAPCQALVPSLYDLSGFSYFQMRCALGLHATQLLKPVAWHRRRRAVFWRGGKQPPDSCARRLRKPFPRVRLASMAASRAHRRWLNASSDPSDRVGQHEFTHYRYLLDIGGTSCTTWASLRWKLATGSLLLIVTMAGGELRDWIHTLLRPHHHYLPVREDLSDLHERWAWAEAHPEAARAIAERGAKVALRSAQPAATLDALVDTVAADGVLMDHHGAPEAAAWECVGGAACAARRGGAERLLKVAAGKHFLLKPGDASPGGGGGGGAGPPRGGHGASEGRDHSARPPRRRGTAAF